MFFYIYYYLFR